ncbi:3-keto-disaccharide hydrolase [Pontiella sulfatireligans]|uniref:3-keto-alpha-glucoside-1,2-lyase/3-keto-2-hydroxy-glucal hydratase domain-containing protein n=1 Tax=Pontiella sulfatireligans TaxID=2750658 RepID=A0A6C2UHF5_9BACT|nr:DUF1080 domain-containing protein [Pontiella sulfatireligans]VGO19293.1 hypothetical protein SCARR_01351 [Pontiella sulfatireligans]
MKKTLFITASSALLLLAGCTTQQVDQQANTISESQQQYIKKYEKQKVVPKPEDMLLNTEKEPKLKRGFTPLFNGKDLTGWTPKGGKCTFEAIDGTIKGTCIKGSPSTYLSTDKADYTDFIFTCDMKWEVTSNSGVMMRAQSKPGEKGETVFGPQCEMEGFSQDRGWSGGIYGQACGGWYYPLWLEAHATVRKALNEGEWNRVTIKAQGDTFKTWINGIPAANWKNEEYKQGFFSLQVHAGKEGTILWRNIKVKEL